MAICLSHSGEAIYSSSVASNELFVGTADGVFLLARDGVDGSWRVARDSLKGYHVCSLMIEPSSGALFAGTHNGGVAVSRDSARSWSFCNQGLSSLNVYSLAYAKSGAGVKIYTGTEPAHLFVSTDLGASWRELSSMRSVPNLKEWNFPAPPHVAHVKVINIDPYDPDCIYACVEQGELLRSTDGGATWQDLLGPAGILKASEGDAHRLIIRPSNPREMFMPTGFGFFHSLDAGATWSNDADRISRIGYPDPLVYHPGRDSLMFLAGARHNPGTWMKSKNADPAVARSRDGGQSWELIMHGLPQPLKANFEAMTLEACADRSALFLGDTDGSVYYSRDEGENWERIAARLPAISKGAHYMVLKEGFGRAA
ncbi:MAG TPA: hypothetical protein VKV28_15555 [Candidatus Binataceae bacterium]|nr:hypothetical protein [Candidatus Binataceae bacterium]